MVQNSWHKIQIRWTVDPLFRTAMKTDPKKTLKDEFGLDIADDVQIILHVPTSAKEVHLVMPAPMAEDLMDVHAVNDGRKVTIACTSSVPGGTCWNTPNCPTQTTCSGKPC